MAKFKKLSDLEKFIREKILDSLGNEVVEKVKDVEIKNIRDKVYNVYPNPKVYKRRFEDEGLLDRNNIVAYPQYNGYQYEIVNETKKKGRNEYLAPLIELGHQGARAQGDIGYEHPRFGLAYMRPRKFTEATIKELEETNEHVDTMREGLKARGLDVR